MKLHTVNVVEVINNSPYQLISFKDNPEGNKQAEKLFAQMIKENGAEKDNIDFYIEEGSYDHSNNEYGCYLIHST
jgi:hypothetical protein